MKELLNECYRSEIKVSPANWATDKADISVEWKVHCRFYDPVFKGTEFWGYQVVKRQMNREKGLERRREFTKVVIDEIVQLLDKENYNPVTKKYMTSGSVVSQDVPKLTRETPLMAALYLTLKDLKSTHTKPTNDAMKGTLKYFGASAEIMKKSHIPIIDVNCEDILEILNNVPNVPVIRKKGGKEIIQNKIWTTHQFNHYRKHLHGLFKYLYKQTVVMGNVIELIDKKEEIEDPDKRRTVVTTEDRQMIDKYVREKLPRFYRFINIYFHGGSRETELFRMKGKDVDLERQLFKVLILKGKKKRYVWKTIKDIALPFWISAMNDGVDENGETRGCLPDEYVFNKELRPGLGHNGQPLRYEQLTRRWRIHVKKKLGINSDFTTLRHASTAEVTDILLEQEAAERILTKQVAEHNGHTTEIMNAKVYDIHYAKRKHERLKKVGNSFV